jgi:hypothetical protein
MGTFPVHGLPKVEGVVVVDEVHDDCAYLMDLFFFEGSF